MKMITIMTSQDILSDLIVFNPTPLKKKKGKAVPLQARWGPEAQDGGRLSALRTGRLYPKEILLVLVSFRG